MRVLLTLSCFLMLSGSFAMGKDKKEEATSRAQELMVLFQQVLSELEANYVEEVSKEKLMEAALNGILSLDPHSSYVNKKDFKEFKEQAKGQIIGIGMEFINENGLIKVIAPIEDAPAAVAGLKSGDFIFKVNNEAVFGMSTDEIVKKLRGGAAGSVVNLSIYRPGKDPFDIKVKRDIIKVKTVKARVEDNVGYIRISSFMSEKTTEMVKAALDDFKKHHKNSLQGLVLDLRNNAGGQIEQAVGICNLFLENVEIVSTRGRGSHQVEHFMAGPQQYADQTLPLVVLINGGSASASEIVAGALQDHKRAIIMGTKSFGKASVQLFKTVLGDRAIKYTIARYYTPLGRSIQAQGIIPDVLVDYMKFEKISDESRFREKDYKGALKADAKLEEIIKTKKTTKAGGKAQETKPEDQDYPLVRALELVKSIWIYNKTLAPKRHTENPESPEACSPATRSCSLQKNPETIDWKKHTTAFENPQKKPMLSIIMHGSQASSFTLTEKAISETPRTITLAFSAYNYILKELGKKAREKNHEILLTLPLDAQIQDKKNLPLKTLHAPSSETENLKKLPLLLGQTENYVGLLNLTGRPFIHLEKSVLKTLTQKNIPYIEATPVAALALSPSIKVPHTMVETQIAEGSSQEIIDQLFEKAIRLAKSKGHSTLLVPLDALILKKITELEVDIKKEGVLLAPISQMLLKKDK